MDTPACINCHQRPQARNGQLRRLCRQCSDDPEIRSRFPSRRGWWKGTDTEDMTLEELNRIEAEQRPTMPEERGQEEPARLSRLQLKALSIGIALDVRID